MHRTWCWKALHITEKKHMQKQETNTAISRKTLLNTFRKWSQIAHQKKKIYNRSHWKSLQRYAQIKKRAHVDRKQKLWLSVKKGNFKKTKLDWNVISKAKDKTKKYWIEFFYKSQEQNKCTPQRKLNITWHKKTGAEKWRRRRRRRRRRTVQKIKRNHRI